ncbi:MAG TPA: hypothetical protein VFV08_07865, partial [Puia sp.]|nr:hypothetical protein [Puia sp.]
MITLQCLMRLITFIIIILISLGQACKQPAGSADMPAVHLSGCSEPQKIPVEKMNVYDLSGYADEGGGDPFNLFDENAYVDPRYERKGDNFIPVTNCQPRNHPGIYFPANRGSRIVVDLLNPYRITDIFLYDRSQSADSVWLYTGDMNQWKLKSAFETKSEPGAWGWRRFSLEDSSRYFMIRFNSYQTQITEAVLYGCSMGSQEKME